MKRKRLFLLGEGYPWYMAKNGTYPWDTVRLYKQPDTRSQDWETVALKTKWGAWKKVKLWIEAVE